MSIRRIKCNECLTGMYDFNKKQAFSCRYRQENSYICIKLVSFLPIIYGIPHYKALLDYFTIKY